MNFYLWAPNYRQNHLFDAVLFRAQTRIYKKCAFAAQEIKATHIEWSFQNQVWTFYSRKYASSYPLAVCTRGGRDVLLNMSLLFLKSGSMKTNKLPTFYQINCGTWFRNEHFSLDDLYCSSIINHKRNDVMEYRHHRETERHLYQTCVSRKIEVPRDVRNSKSP